MRVFWWQNDNFGDIITPILLRNYLDVGIEHVGPKANNKFLGVGSIIGTAMQKGDTVWGSGILRDKTVEKPEGVDLLAVRGPLTRKRIKNASINEYGDPGLLVSDVYDPDVEVQRELGVIPHFIEQDEYKDHPGFIDIRDDWKEVVKEVKKCNTIASSSLHGIITAEAYGKDAIWMKPGPDVKGTHLKYQDYFLGTGREKQKVNSKVDPLENLNEIQDNLKSCLMSFIHIEKTQTGQS